METRSVVLAVVLQLSSRDNQILKQQASVLQQVNAKWLRIRRAFSIKLDTDEILYDSDFVKDHAALSRSQGAPPLS